MLDAPWTRLISRSLRAVIAVPVPWDVTRRKHRHRAQAKAFRNVGLVQKNGLMKWDFCNFPFSSIFSPSLVYYQRCLAFLGSSSSPPLHLFLGASLLRVFNRILPPLASTVFVLIDQQCDCSYFAQNLPLVYLITERLKDFRRETRFARCYGSLSMSP